MTTLLLVEDDDTIGRALESSLERHGYEVHWARSGAVALRGAEQTRFDLVLLDLGLPDLDGVEVCRRLRAAQPQTVLVMVTARQDESTSSSAWRRAPTTTWSSRSGSASCWPGSGRTCAGARPPSSRPSRWVRS